MFSSKANAPPAWGDRSQWRVLENSTDISSSTSEPFHVARDGANHRGYDIHGLYRSRKWRWTIFFFSTLMILVIGYEVDHLKSQDTSNFVHPVTEKIDRLTGNNKSIASKPSSGSGPDDKFDCRLC